MKQRKLSAQEANRLAVHLQVVKIKLMEFSVKYSFKGKSQLWNIDVDASAILREKSKLAELYRLKEIFETKKYRELPYLPSGHGSTVERIKEHYLVDEGTIGFVEVKESSHGKSVINHLWSKKTIARRIKKKQQSSKRKLKKNGNKKEGGQKTTSSRRRG